VEEQNGLYHLKDPTFGNDLWISKAALENETSGYYLIADKGSLPEGWEAVNAEEAKSVRGMGNTGDNDPPYPDDKKHPPGCGDEGGMASYNFSSMAVSLNVFDKPLHYKPAVGPDISFRVNYSQRDVGQPANFNYSNLGAKWSHNWLGYVVDTPDNLQASVTVIPPRGGFETYINYNTGTHSFDAQRDTQAILTRTQDSPAIYQRKFPDGRMEIYAQLRPAAADGTRQIFLTQVVDPQGNAVTLGYDKKFRLMTLTDTVGKVTQFSYGDKLQNH
jgi:YD repeat-containing protein